MDASLEENSSISGSLLEIFCFSNFILYICHLKEDSHFDSAAKLPV